MVTPLCGALFNEKNCSPKLLEGNKLKKQEWRAERKSSLLLHNFEFYVFINIIIPLVLFSFCE
jgi:hypothetical protein